MLKCYCKRGAHPKLTRIAVNINQYYDKHTTKARRRASIGTNYFKPARQKKSTFRKISKHRLPTSRGRMTHITGGAFNRGDDDLSSVRCPRHSVDHR